MQPVQILSWHQNVAQMALWVGKVSLIQYHRGVLDMLVPKVHLHDHPRPLNWLGTRSCLRWELNPKHPDIIAPDSLVTLLPQPLSRHTVLGLTVCSQ